MAVRTEPAAPLPVAGARKTEGESLGPELWGGLRPCYPPALGAWVLFVRILRGRTSAASQSRARLVTCSIKRAQLIARQVVRSPDRGAQPPAVRRPGSMLQRRCGAAQQMHHSVQRYEVRDSGGTAGRRRCSQSFPSLVLCVLHFASPRYTEWRLMWAVLVRCAGGAGGGADAGGANNYYILLLY